MELTILIDNKPGDGLSAEYGLSVWIESGELKLLLDTGASGAFVKNAAALGIDLRQAACGVLSHAHYDHAGGLAAFFAQNGTAPFYLRAGTAENCCKKGGLFGRYIGIHRGWLDTYRKRIVYAAGAFSIAPGVTLLGHTTPGLSEAGQRAGLYQRRGLRLVPDDFSHEQTLVMDTPKGLVVLNSCCHAGADVVLQEAQAAYPDKRVHALVGGFHLLHASEAEVRALAGRLKALGVEHFYTGHCTGDQAFRILQEELGDAVTQFHTGSQFSL